MGGHVVPEEEVRLQRVDCFDVPALSCALAMILDELNITSSEANYASIMR